MRFKYTIQRSGQDDYDSLPWLPLQLFNAHDQVDVMALVDSGATVNVLPYTVGLRLGNIWDESKARYLLAGSFERIECIPLIAFGRVSGYEPAKLVFAWTHSDSLPVILGQVNFMQFDVCLFRSQLEFEVKPRSL